MSLTDTLGAEVIAWSYDNAELRELTISKGASSGGSSNNDDVDDAVVDETESVIEALGREIGGLNVEHSTPP
jgi:hypothetical protein